MISFFKNTIFGGLLGSDNIDGLPTKSATELVTNGLNMAYYIIGAIAVIMIIIAGFTMVTSVGDAEAIKKAKNTITYSVIGLIFVVLAFAVTYFVKETFK